MNGALPRVTIRDTQFEFIQGAADPSLLQAALRAGVPLPYECSSGGCGSCRVKIVGGTHDSLWASAPGLSLRDRARGFVLACQTRATSDLELVVSLDESRVTTILPKRVKARLVQTEQLTPEMCNFSFVVDQQAAFIPGQYAILEYEGLRRAYSMSNIPNNSGRWEFIVKRVAGGKFSDGLFSGRIDSVLIDGPYGFAHVRRESARDVLCVAGGSGLSPMVSIARSVAMDPTQRRKRIDFFYGGRTPGDLCAEQQLARLPGCAERLVIHSVVSDRDHPSTATWSGPTGFVHEHVGTTMSADVRDREIYFAGPPPMAEAMQRLLVLDFRVPLEQIHFDRFF